MTLTRILASSLVASTILLCPVASGQTPQPLTVNLPPLSLDGSTLDWTMSYDSSRGVYRYEYTLNAAATNKAPIASVHIDVNGRLARAQDDPQLQGNATPLVPIQVQPATTIPVKLSMPLSFGNDAFGMTNAAGEAVFGVSGGAITAGKSIGGWVIESRFPPGIRNVLIRPSSSAWNRVRAQYATPAYAGQDIEFSPADPSIYELHLQTIAPSDPTDADLYSGGGQNPAEVNKFLRYTSPKDNRVKVPAGTPSYTMIVFYGATVVPSTFTASLNGADVTSMFKPAPGSAQAVKIPLGAGTTRLQLAVDGVKSDGHRATDTDAFTFLPQ